MESVQVVIVGGGVAGLAAAKTLGSKVNYVLIEAQNYLGGRIRTIDAGNRQFFSNDFHFLIFLSYLAPNFTIDLVNELID